MGEFGRARTVYPGRASRLDPVLVTHPIARLLVIAMVAVLTGP
jgi:hypothetical protein